MNKKFVCKLKVVATIMLCFILSWCNINFIEAEKVVDEGKIQIIESTFEVDIVESSKILLYGSDDEIDAYFYNLNPVGYMIIDSSTYGVIEYSIEANNKYIIDKDKTYYYGGPLEYYQSTTKNVVDVFDCKSYKSTKKKTIDFKSKVKLSNQIKEKKSSYNIVEPLFVTSNSGLISLDYLTRAYDTNNNGNCGSTAAAIYFMYLYDNVSTSYVKSSYVTSNGQKLTDLLISYIEPNGGGSTVSKLKSGMNDYLDDISISNKMAYITKFNILTTPTNKMESCIYDNRPCIVGLDSAPTYGNHWVVATGFQKNISFAYVNDGWGNRGIRISYNYIDSCVYMK